MMTLDYHRLSKAQRRRVSIVCEKDTLVDDLPEYAEDAEVSERRLSSPPRYTLVFGGKALTILSKLEDLTDEEGEESSTELGLKSEHLSEAHPQSRTPAFQPHPEPQIASPLSPSPSYENFITSSNFHLRDKSGKPFVTLEIFGRKTLKRKPIIHPGDCIEGLIFVDSRRGMPSSVSLEVRNLVIWRCQR
jgi:hypothetical protein